MVGGDRAAQHGNKLDNHYKIAALWSAYLRIRRSSAGMDMDLMPSDVAHMMVLLKVARTQLGSLNLDDWVDMAGYAAVAGDIAQQEGKAP